MINIKKYSGYIYSAVLVLACVLMYFRGLSDFAFSDNSETMFVSIAKEMLIDSEWFNVGLTGENVSHIPPLLFIIVNSLCLLFGKINAEILRMPGAVISFAAIILIYRFLRNVLTKTYAFIIAFIAATSLGMIVYSHLATNDILSAVFMMITVMIAQKILLFKDADNMKYRIFGYVFAAASILSCGVLGFIIPFFSITAMKIFSGNIEDMSNRKNIVPGAILLSVIISPWLITGLRMHGFDFLKDNLSVCNFLTSAGTKEILYVAAVFIIGFLPWSFSFIWSAGSRYKEILYSVFSYFKDNSNDKLKAKWQKLNKINRFISLNTVFFFTVSVFALLYGAKNMYIILLLIFPASCIAGYYWYHYMIRREHNKSIIFATVVPDLILIVLSVVGLFGHNAINKYVVSGLNNLIVPIVIIFFVIPLISVFAVILKERKIPFIANVILMISLSFVIFPDTFNLISYNTGENDLISFSGLANEKNVELSAYISEKKYSLMYYYDKDVEFLEYGNINTLKEYLDKNPETRVVVEIKDMKEIEDNNIKYILADSGKKYCVIQKMPRDMEKMQIEEPGIIIY